MTATLENNTAYGAASAWGSNVPWTITVDSQAGTAGDNSPRREYPDKYSEQPVSTGSRSALPFGVCFPLFKLKGSEYLCNLN